MTTEERLSYRRVKIVFWNPVALLTSVLSVWTFAKSLAAAMRAIVRFIITKRPRITLRLFARLLR